MELEKSILMTSESNHKYPYLSSTDPRQSSWWLIACPLKGAYMSGYKRYLMIF